MTQRQWKTPVLVIADDFTGANDAGAGFAQAGARVNVLFDITTRDQSAAADVWAISTDSRAVDAAEAARRTHAVLDNWREVARSGWVFKKIDSTLRGNPGAETQAALLASGAKAALIVPAVPRLGRITREGQCYIHGVLLTETEFASDPKTPVTQASVAARFRAQSEFSVGQIGLATVRQPGLADALERAIEAGERLIVLDAESDNDLHCIMRAAAQLPHRPLLVGAAGLSDALSTHLAAAPAAPALAVVGSMSTIAARQIARAQHGNTAVVDVDIAQLFTTPAWPDATAWQTAAIGALREGCHCIIRTCQQAGQRLEIDALCARHGVTRQQLGERICDFLAVLTRDILRDVRPAGLYLSGGDVAIAVSRGMGATGFQIQGQVAGCVPYGRLLNTKNNLLVLTKAGGFGDESTLTDVFRFIEEKASE
ncbi:four-carbon acid sugar kinase family protein [Erwinia sp. 9145]|uniref:D-threonate kinase n=1 Tax=Erwinia sp. 9145 TaxID=1500895 RepID=UPI000550D20F|nr:four-carbon acid sugar kinase family protein [Erwinia sp. 9145]